MGNVILFGEPMALLIAEETGPLEKVEHFTRALSGAEVNVAIGLTRLGHRAEYLTRQGKIPSDIILQIRSKRTGLERSGSPMIRYTVPGSS